MDNFHYDVHLSPVFCESVSRIIFHLIIKSTKADTVLDVEFDWNKEREEFKHLCRDIMLDAVKRAKLGDGEIQIDYLAQIAVCKFLIQEVAHQFEELMTRLNNMVWEYESTDDDEIVLQTIALKEKVLAIRHKRNIIVSEVSKEIFEYLLDAQKQLRERREANYGAQSLLKEDIFINPILHVENQNDAYFMLEQYVLLGNRIDDPDKYEVLLQLISEMLGRIKVSEKREKDEKIFPDREGENTAKQPELENLKIDSWIKEVGNIDLLINYFKTSTKIQERQSKRNHDKDELRRLESMAKEQKKIFKAFYNKFKEKKLLPRIIASFETKAI